METNKNILNENIFADEDVAAEKSCFRNTRKSSIFGTNTESSSRRNTEFTLFDADYEYEKKRESEIVDWINLVQEMKSNYLETKQCDPLPMNVHDLSEEMQTYLKNQKQFYNASISSMETLNAKFKEVFSDVSRKVLELEAVKSMVQDSIEFEMELQRDELYNRYFLQ